MRQAQNGKHTSCASASTSGQLHQAKNCSKFAQRARTASAAAANSGTQGREVRREASSGPALGAKCRGCRPRLQERVLKNIAFPLEKGFKTRNCFACGRIFRGGSLRSPQIGHPGGDHHTRHSQGGVATPGMSRCNPSKSVRRGRCRGGAGLK